MVETETGEFVGRTISHEGNGLREFYAALEGPVVVGIEATGSMQWFLELLEELGIQCRVGHPAKIRAKETRKQKHDRRDARLIWELLIEGRFPEIWMPSTEQPDLRTLLRDRHQWVKMRARLQHTLQAIALNHALRQGHALWSQAGQSALEALPLPPYTSQRRTELLSLYVQLQKRIQELDKEVEAQARQRPQARRLLTHPGVGAVPALATGRAMRLDTKSSKKDRYSLERNQCVCADATCVRNYETNTPKSLDTTGVVRDVDRRPSYPAIPNCERHRHPTVFAPWMPSTLQQVLCRETLPPGP